MIARSNAQLGKEIARVRNELNISFLALAGELHITPEWLSKIVNGHQQPSYNIGLRFQEFLRRRGIATDAGGDQVGFTQGESATLRAAILEQCNELIAGCGDDPQRLRALLSRFGAFRANRLGRKPQAKIPSKRATKAARMALLKERLKLLSKE